MAPQSAFTLLLSPQRYSSERGGEGPWRFLLSLCCPDTDAALRAELASGWAMWSAARNTLSRRDVSSVGQESECCTHVCMQ